MSLLVVINGPVASAGSMPYLFKVIGTNVPMRDAMTMTEMHPQYLRMRFEKEGDLPGAGCMRVHADGQRLQAAFQQETNERVEAATEPQHLRPDAVDQLAAARHRAASNVTVAVEVLRAGMDDDVGPEFERAAADRRQEGVVDDQQDVPAAA